MGLKAYAATAPARSLAASGVRGSRAATQSVSASRLSALVRCLSRKRGFHEVRAAFTDHDAGRIGVSRDEPRHDRGIGHPQSVHRARFERGVDYAFRVGAHAAGANRVIDCVCPAADEVVERFVVVEVDGVPVTRSEGHHRRTFDYPVR